MISPKLDRVRCPDGVELAIRQVAGDGHLVVALHGFSGDAMTMWPLIEKCHDGRPALLVDLIGHGNSAAPEHLEHFSMGSVVDQVLSLIGPHQPGTVHLIGYSMGGRVALSMAARAPWYFGSITTISATPGLDDPVERASRYDLDYQRAAELEAIGVDAFVDQWLQLDLFAPYVSSLSASEFEATTQQRRGSSALGLANSLRGTGTGSMPPVWTALGGLRTPVLAVAGELDSPYVEIASKIAQCAPFGRHEVIPGVGHVAHHENLEDVATLVRAFLAECSSNADHTG